MKKSLLILSLFTLFVSGLSADNFSAFDMQQIASAMDFRFNARNLSSAEEVIQKTKDFHKEMLADNIQSGMSEEAKITLENILVLVEYSAMYEKNPKAAELKPFIMDQYEKIEKWNETHPAEKANPYYLLTSGDLINSTMQYLPQSQAIKLGLEEKANYKKVVEENPEFAFGLINAALWYYYAPAIGGGSTALAKDYLTRAVACAENNYEKFYSNIFLSQLNFEAKNKADAAKYLEDAEKLLPGNRYTAFIRKINSINYSLMYYNNNREKVDAKLASAK